MKGVTCRRARWGAKRRLKPSKESVRYYKDILDSASAHWTAEVAGKEEVMRSVAKIRKFRDAESVIAEGTA